MANLLNKRFTKTLIVEMARTISNHMHNETIEQLQEDSKIISDAIYAEIYKEHLELINSLPKGFLTEHKSTYLNLTDSKGDCVDALQPRFNDKDSYNYKRERKLKGNHSSSNMSVYFTQPRRFLSDHQNGGARFARNHPLTLALLENSERIVNAQVEREETIEQMESMLAEFGNFTALYASWPAVREIIADHEPTPTFSKAKALPPATVFDDFNKKLGIPTKKAMTVSA